MLIHWLPLNGDIKDYGMNAKTWKSTGITYADGQLGKAAVFDGDASKKIWLESPEENQRLTWTCWVKVNSVGTQQYIISQGRDIQIYGLNIFITSDGRINVHCGSKDNVSYLKSTNLATAGEILYIAVTADENYVTLYINGEKHDQTEKKYFDYEYSQDTLVIGKMAYGASSDTQFFPFYGTISDVRIYDNCLSPTEIKELSKGLIVHYPLSSIYESGIRNKYSGEEAAGNLIVSSAWNTYVTKTPLTDERGYNYKLSYTGKGTNSWCSFYLPIFSFTPGKTYYYSCKVRCHSKSSGIVFFLRAARSVNDYGVGLKEVDVLQNPDGEWHEYVVSQIINETYENSNGTITCNPRVEFYSNNMGEEGTLYTFDIDIKDIQVVESNYEVPFIENELCDTVVYDVSGNDYHGSVELDTAPVWNPDSKINNGSFYFDGTDAILFNHPLTQSIENFTISCWVKYEDLSKTEAVCTMRTGIGHGVSLFKFNQRFRFDDGEMNSQLTFSDYTIPLNTWIHVVVTRTSLSKKLYINGELKQTVTDSIGGMNNIYNIGSIGASSVSGNVESLNNFTKGNLSDFRMYATVLSDSDIKSLYNKRFSIDDKGAFYSSAFQEIELSSTTKMVNLVDENKINLIASDGDLVTSTTVENKEVNLSNTGIISIGEFIEMGNYDFIEKTSLYTEYWTPTAIDNVTTTSYFVSFDNLEVGDVVVVELDLEWNGFDESNTDGTFNIFFQGAHFKDGTAYWITNNITNSLNDTAHPKTLVLGSTVGYYHYVAESTITDVDKTYDSIRIGMRSNYSNGTGTIRITNGHAYKKSDYLGNEKTRFDSYVESKEFIENF